MRTPATRATGSCRSSRWPRSPTDPVERTEWLTFVVIGAAPTVVELIAQIAELAHTVLPRDYRSVNTHEARVILLEGAGAVLPPFVPRLQEYTKKRLEEMGVEVRLNTLTVDMDHESITVKGPDGVVKGSDGVDTIRTRTGSGWPGCRPPRWRGCRRRRPVWRPTGPAGSRSIRTARCPDIRRSSRSATWSR